MNYKNKKRLQIINYIVSQLNGENGYMKEFLIKMVYLADKLFLLRYGATITSDSFLAFERGTACSETLAIMNLDKEHIEDEDDQVVKTFKNTYNFNFTPSTKNVHTLFINGKLNNNFSTLSKAEMETMDIIINAFGNKSYDEISEYTHQFKEWQPFKDKFNDCGANKYCSVDMKDVFEDRTFMHHEELKKYISEESIQNAIDFYNGDYCD